MRKAIDFNNNWYFQHQNNGPAFALAQGDAVTLPHTWNAKDGQDGGNDYYRGTCWYVKKFEKPELGADEEAWLEFEGAAMTAEVYLNGDKTGAPRGRVFHIPCQSYRGAG